MRSADIKTTGNEKFSLSYRAYGQAGLLRHEALPVALQAQLLIGQISLNHGRLDDAFAFFEIAARSQHPVALNLLGRAYERGWGVSRNPRVAAHYFREAADEGDGWAMFNLADLFLNGEGVEQDRNRAYELYSRAARAGNPKALNMLGLLHEEGITGAPDPQKAKIFFEAGAERGDCWAWLNLGRLALQKEDVAAALPLLRRALEHGFPDFFACLARFLRKYDDLRLQGLAIEAARKSHVP